MKALFLWLLWMPLVAFAAPPVMVVWPFEEVTFLPDRLDHGKLGGLAQEVITATLMQDGRLEVVERERLDRILEELNLNCSGLAARDACQQVGKIVGADKMVFGEYLRLPDGRTRVLVRIVDVETSLVDAGLEATVSGGADPYAVLTRLGCEIAARLRKRNGPAGQADPSEAR